MHGRGNNSKEKQQRLVKLIDEEGGACAIALQHTGVTSRADAKRLTRLFGSSACGVFATNIGRMIVESVAIIFPNGAEDITVREAEGRWLAAEATGDGHRFAVSSIYLPTNAAERVKMLRDRHGLPDLDAAKWLHGSLEGTGILCSTYQIGETNMEETQLKATKTRPISRRCRRTGTWLRSRGSGARQRRLIL